MRVVVVALIATVGPCMDDGEEAAPTGLGPSCDALYEVCAEADEYGGEDAASCDETARAADEAACEAILDTCIDLCEIE